ncbi:hypothetical protein XENTR_v10001235 [Xenopus tropicalis]|uniref:Protein TASOR-like n=1 Tax=Xenopus tropicalis TaxID=8364 RepID=A0A8J1IZD9_XENTR|nr:protein TASOR-like [Xenopus tropicalis]KAE8631580.1 hypothetical protein XENTR_v10001235 [Xenopus tropicalis]
METSEQFKDKMEDKWKSLKSYVIPKVKTAAERGYLARDMTSEREYYDFLDILNKARLNTLCELKSSWDFGEPKMICNPDLEKKYFEKRSEIREYGKNYLKEQFCFLVLTKAATVDIWQNGLSINSSSFNKLGNPQLGVYVFRHIDVALIWAQINSKNSDVVIVFKVLFGRVKKIQKIGETDLKPTSEFDSHVSSNIPTWSDSFDAQISNSLVYLYEHDINCKPVDKPRHCLPYASVSVRFLGQKTGTDLVHTHVARLKLKSESERESETKQTSFKHISKRKFSLQQYEKSGVPLPKKRSTVYCKDYFFSTRTTGIKGPLSNILSSPENAEDGVVPKEFHPREVIDPSLN